jgi:hypothetical protein
MKPFQMLGKSPEPAQVNLARQTGPSSKEKTQTPNGIYHKDYQFDPDTGRIYGHGPGNPHGDFKHINVKLPDGTKVTIIIEPN